MCLRRAFHVENPADLTGLVLEIEYDDGFVAFINGTRVAERNLSPDEHRIDGLARGHIEKAREQIPLEGARDLLVPGANMLALVAHNASLTSSDLLIDARLVDGTVVREDGPNLLKGGDFEEPLSLDDTGVAGWFIEGTRHPLGPKPSGSDLGDGIAEGGGDGKGGQQGQPDRDRAASPRHGSPLCHLLRRQLGRRLL